MKISALVLLIPILIKKNIHRMSARELFKSSLKKIMKSRVIIRCVAFLAYLYSKFTGNTCHWQIKGVNETLASVKDTNAIFVGWHSRATMMPFFQNKLLKRNMAAIVSPHQDGQIVANLLKHFEIKPINGSSNENPRQSALELMRDLLKGYDLFISPDGPRGPRMRMKKSPIYFAQKTGKPIICVCFSLNKALIIDTAWDKTMIALPFAKGVFALSEPLYVPSDLTEEEVEQYRQKLENIANAQSIECDKMVGREPVMPADVDDYKKKRMF